MVSRAYSKKDVLQLLKNMQRIYGRNNYELNNLINLVKVMYDDVKIIFYIGESGYMSKDVKKVYLSFNFGKDAFMKYIYGLK